MHIFSKKPKSSDLAFKKLSECIDVWRSGQVIIGVPKPQNSTIYELIDVANRIKTTSTNFEIIPVLQHCGILFSISNNQIKIFLKET